MIEEEAINKFEINNEFLHICNIASIKKYCVQIFLSHKFLQVFSIL